MRIIRTRNIHQALPIALDLMKEIGQIRGSRNGPVLVAPCPVVTEYTRPWERVSFWKQRDANPFLHLYESLWMLAGRNDLRPLLKFTKNFSKYSDDGVIMHGAYGYRWRMSAAGDQLSKIAYSLRRNPDDRRCVLQMWNAAQDLAKDGVDFPCNLMATFQRNDAGELDMTVFCRSNDIIWGCYGANAVHFSILQEYMARWIGCEIGVYRQISVNWHAYVDVFNKVCHPEYDVMDRPYGQQEVRYASPTLVEWEQALVIVHNAIDNNFFQVDFCSEWSSWTRLLYTIFKAHWMFRSYAAPENYIQPLAYLNLEDPHNDWIVACRQWLQRRYDNWERKMKS